MTVEEALASEAESRLPLSPFYDTPQPFPSGAPGDLIRFEEAADYMFVPDGTNTGTRIYRFLSFAHLRRKGCAGLRRDHPPLRQAAGRRLAGDRSWAHGTTGVARTAAPSLDSHLVYGWEGVLLWPVLGYAVVATDYAGLGTNVAHQYLVGASQANDVINGLAAARAAVPDLGPKWVAVGHSQGARAVIEVGMMENAIRDPGYLGAISLAPGGGDPGQFLEALQQTPYRGYIAFVAFGAKASFADFKYDEVLTPEAMAHMPTAEKAGWIGTMATFAWEVPPGKMLRNDWRKGEDFNRYTAMSLTIDKPVYQPILLLAGGADTTTPPQSVEAALDEPAQGGRRRRHLPDLSGLDHDPLVFGSFRDQFRWVEDRFAGSPVK